MSILLHGLPLELAEVLAARLVAQDDEVRVLLQSGEDASSLRALGVHPATGDHLDDDDLWERACQNVRTVVIGGSPSAGNLQAALKGARAASVGRFIYVDPKPAASTVEALRNSRCEYVVLASGRKGLFGKSPVDVQDLAEAIDAADDLASKTALELDLGDVASWEQLRLASPDLG